MTIVDPTSAGDDGYIEENTNKPHPRGTVAQKYLALHVPDFSHDLHSYLCLGSDTQWQADSAAAGTKTSVYGDALADMVLGFCDDDRPGGTAQDPVLPPAEGVDDTGSKNLSMANTSLTNESSLLHTKGGWRDHSDGNRITTTYGDKVEVIRGNYKLLVLGRQDSPTAQVAGWDISGGLISTDVNSLNYPPAQDPTAVNPQAKYGGQQLLNTQYTWQEDSDGNWSWTMVTETGEYSPTVNQGNGRVVSYTWVDEKYSYVGSPKPSAGAATGNPEDWEDKSAPRPAKTIVERQWGETITTEVHAMAATAPASPVPGFVPLPPSLTTTVTSDGILTSTTTVADLLTTNVTSSGDLTTTTSVSGTQTVTTTAGSQAIDNTFGSWDMAGWSIGVSLGTSAIGAAVVLGGEGNIGSPDDAPAGGWDQAAYPGQVSTGQPVPGDGFNIGSDPAANPLPNGYYGSGSMWGRSAVGFIGKVGPTIAGFADSGAISAALTEHTTFKGPASRTINTFGTNSTTNWSIGALSNTDATLGTRSITSAALLTSELKVSALTSASIKIALTSSAFDIAVMNTTSTVFAATSLQNDLTNRVINQAPSLVLNVLNLVKCVVSETAGHVNKDHLASMHTFGSLIHLLF